MYVKYIRVYYFNLFIFIRLVSAISFKVYLYVGGHNLFWNFFTRSISTAKGSQIRYTLFQKRWRRDLWRSRATIGLRKIQSWQYWLERRPMCIENCTKDNGSPIVAKLGLDQSSFVHLVYEITTLKFYPLKDTPSARKESNKIKIKYRKYIKFVLLSRDVNTNNFSAIIFQLINDFTRGIL